MRRDIFALFVCLAMTTPWITVCAQEFDILRYDVSQYPKVRATIDIRHLSIVDRVPQLSEFDVLEQGQPQTITSIRYDTASIPRSICIAVLTPSSRFAIPSWPYLPPIGAGATSVAVLGADGTDVRVYSDYSSDPVVVNQALDASLGGIPSNDLADLLVDDSNSVAEFVRRTSTPDVVLLVVGNEVPSWQQDVARIQRALSDRNVELWIFHAGRPSDLGILDALARALRGEALPHSTGDDYSLRALRRYSERMAGSCDVEWTSSLSGCVDGSQVIISDMATGTFGGFTYRTESDHYYRVTAKPRFVVVNPPRTTGTLDTTILLSTTSVSPFTINVSSPLPGVLLDVTSATIAAGNPARVRVQFTRTANGPLRLPITVTSPNSCPKTIPIIFNDDVRQGYTDNPILISPRGGEVISPGTSIPIQARYFDISTGGEAEYSGDGGITWTRADVDFSLTPPRWRIPDIEIPSCLFRIRTPLLERFFIVDSMKQTAVNPNLEWTADRNDSWILVSQPGGSSAYLDPMELVEFDKAEYSLGNGNDIAWTADKSRFVIGGHDTALTVVDASSLERIKTIRLPRPSLLPDVAMSRDGSRILARVTRGKLLFSDEAQSSLGFILWDSTGTVLLDSIFTVWDAALSPDGINVAYVSPGHSAILNVNSKTAVTLSIPTPQDISSTIMDFSDDGRFLAVSCQYGQMPREFMIFNVQSGEEIFRRTAPSASEFRPFQWSPTEPVVAFGADTTICTFDARNSSLTTQPNRGSLTRRDLQISFSPDGSMIASSEASMAIWSSRLREPLGITKIHENPTTSTQFHSWLSSGKHMFAKGGSLRNGLLFKLRLDTNSRTTSWQSTNGPVSIRRVAARANVDTVHMGDVFISSFRDSSVVNVVCGDSDVPVRIQSITNVTPGAPFSYGMLPDSTMSKDECNTAIIRFSPTSVGRFETWAVFTHSGGSDSIYVTGNGVLPTPNIRFDAPDRLTSVCNIPVDTTIFVTLVQGVVDRRVDVLELTSTPPGAFTLLNRDAVINSPIRPGESIAIRIRFDPGVSRTAHARLTCAVFAPFHRRPYSIEIDGTTDSAVVAANVVDLRTPIQARSVFVDSNVVISSSSPTPIRVTAIAGPGIVGLQPSSFTVGGNQPSVQVTFRLQTSFVSDTTATTLTFVTEACPDSIVIPLQAYVEATTSNKPILTVGSFRIPSGTAYTVTPILIGDEEAVRLIPGELSLAVWFDPAITLPASPSARQFVQIVDRRAWIPMRIDQSIEFIALLGPDSTTILEPIVDRGSAGFVFTAPGTLIVTDVCLDGNGPRFFDPSSPTRLPLTVSIVQQGVRLRAPSTARPERGSILISDVLGRILHSESFGTSTDSSTVVDISLDDFSRGVYVVTTILADSIQSFTVAW